MPAATPAGRSGRLPLSQRSTQELTNFLRDASVSAMSEKFFRQRPAAQRDQHPQLRVLLLELGELVQVAGDRLTGDVGHAVDAELGRERRLPVGPRVGRAADAGRGHVAERVVEVGEAGRRPRALHLAELEVAGVDAPLGEVADLDVRLLVLVCLRCRGRGRDGHREGGGHGDEAAG
jgi:hypothetical protein